MFIAILRTATLQTGPIFRSISKTPEEGRKPVPVSWMARGRRRGAQTQRRPRPRSACKACLGGVAPLALSPSICPFLLGMPFGPNMFDSGPFSRSGAALSGRGSPRPVTKPDTSPQEIPAAKPLRRPFCGWGGGGGDSAQFVLKTAGFFCDRTVFLLFKNVIIHPSNKAWIL